MTAPTSLASTVPASTDPSSYASFLWAVRKGDPQRFEPIQLGGRVPFVDRAQSVQFL
jgi:hypothetical protein